jgi:GLPGLI family protein
MLDFALSQKSIDILKFRASYTFNYKTNEEQPDYKETDLMFLDIGDENSKFYSYSQFARDSIRDSGVKQGLSMYEITENMKKKKKGIRNIVYTFTNENKFHVFENFVKDYYYIEQRILPKWEISQDIKEIAGYKCQKAITNYLGRDWIVYFTTEIPIHQGPWKLWGLPGLIVEATESNMYFTYKLNGFEKIIGNFQIVYDNKTISGKEFTNVTKKDFQRMEKLLHSDFLEFTRIYIMEGKGSIHQNEEEKKYYQQIKQKGGVSYIPLEPY